MKEFDYIEKWKKLLTPDIVNYLTTIHEYRGEQRLIAERRADVLNTIHESFQHIPIRDTFILQLHRDLYRFENANYSSHLRRLYRRLNSA